MSAAAMVSERDAVKRERQAYVLGCRSGVEGDRWGADDLRGAEVEASCMFPLPKVTRPREVTCKGCGNYKFRVVGGFIHERGPMDGVWHEVSTWNIGAEMVAMFADLLANPTEEVEDVV